MNKIPTLTITGTIEKGATDSVLDPVAVIEEIKWSINDGRIRLMIQYYESVDAYNNGASPISAQLFGLPREIYIDPTDDFFNSVTGAVPKAVSDSSEADIATADVAVELNEVEEEKKT